MDINILKERFEGTCYVCEYCNGKACAGIIPGMGGREDNGAFIRNVHDLDEFSLDKNIYFSKEYDFFGKKIKSPVIIAPITGADENFGAYLSEDEYCHMIANASKKVGNIAVFGDGVEEYKFMSGIYAAKRFNLKAVFMIKPWKDLDVFERKIRLAENAGAIAVGCDIDSATLPNMTNKNAKIEVIKLEKLKKIISISSLPFIVKGVMDIEHAEMSYNAGASAIVISNHGGRIDSTLPSSISVLSKIARKYSEKLCIMADSGIRKREHVLKMLSAGAEFVMVGRPLIIGAVKNGSKGIADALQNLN